MHEYYKKHTAKLKKRMNSFLKCIKLELESDLKMSYETIFDEAWEIYYHKYMEAFPYIGGDKCSKTVNLTGAYCYIALGDAVRKHGVSLERWGELTTIAYKRYFNRFPKFIMHFLGAFFRHNPKIVKKILNKKDIQNAKNAKQNTGSFETELQLSTDKYFIIFHINVCPLYLLAKRLGCMEYMPYMCNLDYVMYDAFNIPFERTKTCAIGDDYCNYCFKSKGKPTSYWPCHAMDVNDPLV